MQSGIFEPLEIACAMTNGSCKASGKTEVHNKNPFSLFKTSAKLEFLKRGIKTKQFTVRNTTAKLVPASINSDLSRSVGAKAPGVESFGKG